MNSVNQAYQLNHDQQLWADSTYTSNGERQAKLEAREKAKTTREQHTILNRILTGGSISAGFLLLFLLVTPMLMKWETAWGNRDPADSSDVKSFYYNDSYTIELYDGTEKVIEYYNPDVCYNQLDPYQSCGVDALLESPFMSEVNNYETLRDVYTNTDSNNTIESVEGFLSSLDTVMDVGRGMYKYFANLVDVGQTVFNPVNHTINKLWSWLKAPFD